MGEFTGVLVDKGVAIVGNGEQLSVGQLCGDHDVARYLADVTAMKQRFAQLAAGDQ